MNDEIKVKARIYRSGENGKPARYDKFEIAGRSTMRVLELLRRIYEETAPDLAFQYSCRVGRCGTCAVRVNGQPALACQERVKKNITIEPLAQFPVVRDLVIDRTAADHLYAALELAPKRQQEHEAKPDWLPVNTARKVAFMGHCISCI